jgi:hypothetical protein
MGESFVRNFEWAKRTWINNSFILFFPIKNSKFI